MAKMMSPTKVITGPKTLWSYLNAFRPKSINGGTPRFSGQFRIPKTDTKTIEKINAAMRAAYEEGKDKLKGSGKSVPAYETLKKPLRDGDAEFPDDETYAGYYFVNANNTIAPGIVDADKQPIIDENEVYSGCYGRASLSFFAFNTNGNKGIACSLNNLQKISDGPRLGGHASAEDDFSDLDDDDEDFLS